MSDEYRQQLIMDIAEAGHEGINVSNLSAKSNLSRPAISHHLKVLKDSGLIKPKKVGTQIFYQLNLSENFKTVSELINSMENILAKINEIDGQLAIYIISNSESIIAPATVAAVSVRIILSPIPQRT